MFSEKNIESFELEKKEPEEIVIEDLPKENPIPVEEKVDFDNQSTTDASQEVVKEETINESKAEDIPAAIQNVEEAEPSYEEIVVLLKQYFNALRDSIRLAKTKDDTIVKMKNELAKYRDDFGYTILKQIISSLISFREDAKNTLRNIIKFSPDVETTKKYLSYLNDDFVEILSTFGIQIDEENYFLDGTNINEIKLKKVSNYVPSEMVFESLEAVEEEKHEDAKKVSSLRDVVSLIEENKTNIEKILKDNSLLDEAFRDVEKIAASVDQNYADAILLPTLKKITGFYTKLKKMIDSTITCLNEDNKTSLYSDVLVYVISITSDLLSELGVEINVDISNVYDMKTNRMLKFVPTDNIELDKTIAFRHTDTYLYNGKVIYLCKVDVYKYEQK